MPDFTKWPMGNLRYLLTGVPALITLLLICRAIGKLIEPFGEWVKFQGRCERVELKEQGCGLQVTFQDAQRLTHTAALYTAASQASPIQPGDTVAIVIRREAFHSGCYPATLEEIAGTPVVFLRTEQAPAFRKAWLRILLRQVCICVVSLLVFVAMMLICFPPRT